jgi:hypothetical protein
MRYWVLVGLMMGMSLFAEAQAPAKPGDDKKADSTPDVLKDQIEKAELVVIGKVAQVGLSAASSFDVGIIEVREVLKGKEGTKTVHFRFPSRGDEAAAQYGKKGAEGVWLLGKEGAYMAARSVVSFRPLTEVDAVKKLIPPQEKRPDLPPDKSKGKP